MLIRFCFLTEGILSNAARMTNFMGQEVDIALCVISKSLIADTPCAAEDGVPGMKSFRKELWFDVKRRREFINVTPQVNKCLSESGIKEGLCLVNAMHITSSVLTSEFS